MFNLLQGASKLQNYCKIDSAPVKHCFAGAQYVLEGLLEIPRVPGVGNVPGPAGIGHHQMYLLLWVFGNIAAYQPQIAAVHTNYPVEARIVLRPHRPGAFGRVPGHSVLAEATLCRRVDGIAVLLIRYGCGFNVILVFHAPGFYQGLHYELRHRAAADVAVADK